MAELHPITTYSVAFTEKEYHLVMMALALLAGGAIKPDSRAKKLAAELNQQLLLREQELLKIRLGVSDRKLEKAPPVPATDADGAEA